VPNKAVGNGKRTVTSNWKIVNSAPENFSTISARIKNMSPLLKKGTPCRSSATKAVSRQVSSTAQAFHAVELATARNYRRT